MNKYCLKENKIEINIKIKKKRLKNFNLRVLNNASVTCSVPLDTTNEEVENFLKRKNKWIIKNVEKYTKLKKITSNNILKNGGGVNILGYSYLVNFIKSDKFKIKFNDLILNIYTNDFNDIDFIQKKYNEFNRKQMKNYYEKILDKFYPIIKKYNIEKPKIKIRKMKTCWGTCNYLKKYITLNENLYKATPLCIEYIVLHEITHLIYPYHNEDFYNFISVHMPDWRDRKLMLNQEFNV